MPTALGFLAPTGPELLVVHGRPRALSLVPNAYRDECHWGSLPWSGSRAAAPSLREITGSQAVGAGASPRPLGFIHRVHCTLCQLLGCGR